ncbi:MAG: hypothetical protein WBW81_10520 [Methylocella sp.]
MRKSAKVVAVIGLALTCTFGNIQLCIANDADEIVFECKYDTPSMRDVHDHIVADNSGITITQYQENTYVRNYTTNENDGTKKSYYRKNRSEVSWGNQYATGELFDSFIDRKTGVLKNTVDGTGHNSTEIGRCTESIP